MSDRTEKQPETEFEERLSEYLALHISRDELLAAHLSTLEAAKREVLERVMHEIIGAPGYADLTIAKNIIADEISRQTRPSQPKNQGGSDK